MYIYIYILQIKLALYILSYPWDNKFTHLVWLSCFVHVIVELAGEVEDLVIKKSCYGLLNCFQLVTSYDFFLQP